MNIGETLVFKGSAGASAGANAKCIKAVGAFLSFRCVCVEILWGGGGFQGIRGNAEDSELHTLSNVTCDFG